MGSSSRSLAEGAAPAGPLGGDTDAVRRQRPKDRGSRRLRDPKPGGNLFACRDAAGEDDRAVDHETRRRHHTTASQGLKPAGGRHLEVPGLRATDDGPRQRMLRVALDGCRHAEDLGVAGVDEGRLTLGEGPGLVEDDGVQNAGSLKRQTILTSSPFRAPSDVEMAMTSGIASPRACGQAMTRTVAVRTRAHSGSPWIHQKTR